MVRVAINGFGRIGRLALRLMAQDSGCCNQYKFRS